MEREGVKEDKIFSVSEINSIIRANLEYTFFDVSVKGEISNFLEYSSGHLYFDIKDEGGKLKCVMFKSYAYKLKIKLKDGEQIIARGMISVYEKRGDLQLIVKEIKKYGIGDLQIKFEQLKKKLQKEGLFDQKYKKKLPFLPKRIGVVTSPQGAAIIDILRIIKRRYAGLYILIYPAKVQGEGAAESIVEGIKELNKIGDLDAIIIGRGGGSIEDLWAFNEEIVARAIFESKIPIISAVGHEIDFTISDFVADLRASTPSAAAELVVERRDVLEDRITSLTNSITNFMRYRIESYKNNLNRLTKHKVFSSFQIGVQRKQFEIDELFNRLNSLFLKQIKNKKERLWKLSTKISNLHPLKRIEKKRGIIELYKKRISADILKKIEEYKHKLDKNSRELSNLIKRTLDEKNFKWKNLNDKLNSLSHKKVLERGYSIVLKENKIIRSSKETEIGDKVKIILYKGNLISEIIKKGEEND